MDLVPALAPAVAAFDLYLLPNINAELLPLPNQGKEVSMLRRGLLYSALHCIVAN